MFASLVCVFLRLTRKQAFLRKIKESLGLQLAMPQFAKTVWAWVCWTLLATQTRKHSLKACAHCPVLHDPEECPLDAVFRWGRDTFKWPFSHLPFGLYMFDIKMVAKKGKRDMYSKLWEKPYHRNSTSVKSQERACSRWIQTEQDTGPIPKRASRLIPPACPLSPHTPKYQSLHRAVQRTRMGCRMGKWRRALETKTVQLPRWWMKLQRPLGVNSKMLIWEARIPSSVTEDFSWAHRGCEDVLLFKSLQLWLLFPQDTDHICFLESCHRKRHKTNNVCPLHIPSFSLSSPSLSFLFFIGINPWEQQRLHTNPREIQFALACNSSNSASWGFQNQG